MYSCGAFDDKDELSTFRGQNLKGQKTKSHGYNPTKYIEQADEPHTSTARCRRFLSRRLQKFIAL